MKCTTSFPEDTVTDFPVSGRVLAMRKYALTMGTLLKGVCYPEEVIKQLRDDRAFDLLNSEKGHQFDPDLVDAFVCNAPNVESIFHEHSD